MLPYFAMTVSRAVVLTLTLATGAVDAVSYFSFDHVFTANMSGNIALLGIGVVNGPATIAGNACALAGFACGALSAARLFPAAARSVRERASCLLAVELGLLISVAVALAAFDVRATAWQRDAACAVVAAAMGIQTGIGRLLAVADVNTTVATMTLHDLVAASRIAGGNSPRWRRRAAVVATLFAGAAVGVALDRLNRAGGLTFTCATVAVAVVMISRGLGQRSSSPQMTGATS
jgi:uncharacterized membrane protein YoaK (UPF0700 family)